MLLSDLPAWLMALLIIPILPNLWTIWHAMHRDFPGEKERYLWVLLAVMVPLVGGIIYFFLGRPRGRKPVPERNGPSLKN